MPKRQQKPIIPTKPHAKHSLCSKRHKRRPFLGLTTAKAQKQWLNDIRKNAPLQESLRTRDDYGELVSLLTRHPKLADVNVHDVFVDEPLFDGLHKKGRCFWVRDHSGFAISLSMDHCVSPHLYDKHRTDPVKLCKEAARREVTLHALDFKKEAYHSVDTLTCALDGTPISFYTTHADHVHEFQYILDDWLTSEGLTYKDIETKRTDIPNAVGVVFADRLLAKRWYKFHDERTGYRVTSVHGNLVTAKSKCL